MWRPRVRRPASPVNEWAHAGFAITLVSALVGHLSVGDDVSHWSWAAGTGVLGGLSYLFHRLLQPAAPAGA